jgi:hypothetical protein
VSWPRIVAAIPWLNTLPPALVARLDLAELVVPHGTAATIRAEVEHALGVYVMTYRPGPHVSGKLQLCQTLEPAPLTAGQLTTLRLAESRLDGIVLCAYARPLRIRPLPRLATADGRGD